MYGNFHDTIIAHNFKWKSIWRSSPLCIYAHCLSSDINLILPFIPCTGGNLGPERQSLWVEGRQHLSIAGPTSFWPITAGKWEPSTVVGVIGSALWSRVKKLPGSVSIVHSLNPLSILIPLILLFILSVCHILRWLLLENVSKGH